MNTASILIFLMSSALLSSCPLGFPPEQACPESSPSCALYVDGDGDALCDNPGPQSVTEPEQFEESPPDTSETVSDSLSTEIVLASDSLPEQNGDVVSLPDDTVFAEISVDSITWTAESTSTEIPVLVETVEEVLIEVVPDSASIDTVAIEETIAPTQTCPLDYSPEQACHEDNPFCAFFIDANADLYCDNPGVRSDTTSVVSADTIGGTNGSETLAGGCPLGLPSEAACPSADNALSPHFMGWDGCVNPSGGGNKSNTDRIDSNWCSVVCRHLPEKTFQGQKKRRQA